MLESLARLAAPLRVRPTAVTAVTVMGIKAGGALLSIAAFTLAARAMSASEFGQFAAWFNAMSFLAVAAVFGQDTLIARSWGEYNGRGEHGMAKQAYVFGWRVTVVSTTIFVAMLLLAAHYFSLVSDPAVLYAGAIFLFAQTLLHFSSHSTRAIAGVTVAELNRELTWRIVLVVVAVATFRHGFGAALFFVGGAAGMVAAVFFQQLATRPHVASLPLPPTSGIGRAAWFGRARSMWLSAMVEAASQYMEVILISQLTSPEVAGEYFVAARVAGVFPMVATGLHAYSLGQCAHLFYSGQIARLQQILRSIAMTTLVFLLPLLAGVVFAGPSILAIFGEHYVAAYPTLVALTFASFVVSLTGPAPGLLLTFGHEQLYSRIITIASVLRIALSAFLATRYGALGAACGWAVVNAPLAVGLAILCRVLCRVEPSILGIVWPTRLAREPGPRTREA